MQRHPDEQNNQLVEVQDDEDEADEEDIASSCSDSGSMESEIDDEDDDVYLLSAETVRLSVGLEPIADIYE